MANNNNVVDQAAVALRTAGRAVRWGSDVVAVALTSEDVGTYVAEFVDAGDGMVDAAIRHEVEGMACEDCDDGAGIDRVTIGVEQVARYADRARRRAAGLRCGVRVSVVDAGLVCDCCALATSNGDVSGCESHCSDGHVERIADYGTESGESVVIGDIVEGVGVFRCAGCGDDGYGVARRVSLVMSV